MTDTWYDNDFLCYIFRPKINEDVIVKVCATEELSKLSYFIIKKNQILVSETVDVPNQKEFTFNFNGTFEMVPRVKLLIYYLKSNVKKK